MTSIALELASWASEFEPSSEDLALAERSLTDTLACALAARGHPLQTVVAECDEPTRWAALGHVLDFDDLHMASTAHVSVVCVMAALASEGDARAYLASAGVMARLGAALGWTHYEKGWHATCTAGAPAAAVAAGVAFGLNRDEIARAIALSIPAAGGVQRAFGTDAKSLQVGFATSAGLRAARLVRAGASADPRVLDEWITLVGGTAAIDLEGPAVPGGLAIKLYPCCYALQRPIAAVQQLRTLDFDEGDIETISVTTQEATVQPLIHHRPTTALEAKFSLEYSVAATILDQNPGFWSFSDEAVQRERAQELIRTVKLDSLPGGDSLLSGEIAIEVCRKNGVSSGASVAVPPGAPTRPPSPEELQVKLVDCGSDVPGLLAGMTWGAAPGLLRSELALSLGQSIS